MNEFDLYCERTDPGLWAEPTNAVTNLAFIVAAVLAFRHAGSERRWPDWLLAGLIAAIGLGSFAFHTMANRVGMLADVIPILAFQLSFLGVHAKRILRLGVIGIGTLYLAFLALVAGVSQLPSEWLNGSMSYFPALIMLLFLSGLQRRAGRAGSARLMWAGGIFVVSLTLRSVDQALCTAWPTGTHAAWHVLNACVLYLCATAVAPKRRQKNAGDRAPANVKEEVFSTR